MDDPVDTYDPFVDLVVRGSKKDDPETSEAAASSIEAKRMV